MTSRIERLEPVDELVTLWNPAGLDILEAARELGVTDGTIAVDGWPGRIRSPPPPLHAIRPGDGRRRADPRRCAVLFGRLAAMTSGSKRDAAWSGAKPSTSASACRSGDGAKSCRRADGAFRRGCGALVEHMGIDLRRRDIGVAEQGLDDPQIGAALQQMAGEGVAQHVRGDAGGRNAGASGEPLEVAGEDLTAQMPVLAVGGKQPRAGRHDRRARPLPRRAHDR